MDRRERRRRQRQERKGRMRYITVEPLVLPKEMKLGSNGADPAHVTLPSFLEMLLDIYNPGLVKGFTLTMQELRSLNKALVVLQGEADNGYYLLDDREYELCKKLLDQLAPIIVISHIRNLPLVMDALVACPDKRPEKDKAAV